MEYLKILREDMIVGDIRFETDKFGQEIVEITNPNYRIHVINIDDMSYIDIHEGDIDTPSSYTFTPNINIIDAGFIPNVHEDDTVININFTKSQGLEIASLLEDLIEERKLETT